MLTISHTIVLDSFKLYLFTRLGLNHLIHMDLFYNALLHLFSFGYLVFQ